jgi:hypothetical protein
MMRSAVRFWLAFNILRDCVLQIEELDDPLYGNMGGPDEFVSFRPSFMFLDVSLFGSRHSALLHFLGFGTCIPMWLSVIFPVMGSPSTPSRVVSLRAPSLRPECKESVCPLSSDFFFEICADLRGSTAWIIDSTCR